MLYSPLICRLCSNPFSLSHAAAQICLATCLDLDEGYNYFGTEFGEEVCFLFTP